MDDRPRYRIIDVPVVGGVATLPDGRTVLSDAKFVRFPMLEGDLSAAFVDDVPDERKAWTTCPACGQYSEIVGRIPGPDSLDAAWREAEAALPEGWSVIEVTRAILGYECEVQGIESEWRAQAVPASPFYPGKEATGPTPAAALRALAERLRNA